MALVEASLAPVLQHLNGGLLERKRLFITGGTGFFGFWLISALAALRRQGVGVSAGVLSRHPDRFLSKHRQFRDAGWLSFIAGDVASFRFADASFDFVLHAAADASAQAERDRLALFDTIVSGARRVLDFALHCGAKRILLVGSGAQYGQPPAPASRFHEDATFACDTTRAHSAYGEAKRASEVLAAIYRERYGLETVCGRCFAFLGPELPLTGSFAIGNFIHDALHAGEIVVNGDGSPLRSYLYGADLAVWLLKALVAGEAGAAYNVGSDREISVGDLAHLVRDTVCPLKPVVVRGGGAASNEPRPRYVPSIERARGDLQLDVWTPLARAIDLTARYAACDPGSA